MLVLGVKPNQPITLALAAPLPAGTVIRVTVTKAGWRPRLRIEAPQEVRVSRGQERSGGGEGAGGETEADWERAAAGVLRGLRL